MKAIKINAMARTVTDIEYDGKIETLYREIECDVFTVVQFDLGKNRVDLFCDDEGMINGQGKGSFIMMSGANPSTPIFGNAVLLGCDGDGEAIDCPISAREASMNILFCDPDDLSDKDRTPDVKIL